MPQNKKQHYVPKFYLKNFSNPKSGKIQLFNLNREKFIFDIPYKDQCYEDYFYGKDLRIENAFQSLETYVSDLFTKIIKNDFLPENGSEAHQALLLHILLQDARTKQTAITQNAILTEFSKNILKEILPDKKEEIETIKVFYENPTELPIFVVAQMLPLVIDLELKILINNTSIDFITSDNPVIFHNQFCEEEKLFGNLGLAKSGLQIFLPLSSKKLLFIYDKAIYRVDSNKNKFVTIYNKNDIENLNSFQVLNCLENIYFENKNNSQIIQPLFNKLKNKRDTLKFKMKEYHEYNSKNKILHLLRPKLDLKLNYTISKIRKKKKIIPIEKRRTLYRDKLLVSLHKEFSKLVQKKKYKVTEFYKFLEEKANKSLNTEFATRGMNSASEKIGGK